MSLTREQLEMRKTGIGGSEIAAILGESRFATPFDVWLTKARDWVKEETEDMRRGTYLEAGIADWYSQRVGDSWRLDSPNRTLRHATVSAALCTPDRLAVAKPDGKPRLVSIKSPRRGGDLWGPDGSDQVPPEYLLQLQWEHAVVGSQVELDSVLHLAALVDGDLRVYVTSADLELQSWLLGYAATWWRQHVVDNIQPSLDGGTEATAWLKSRFPRNTSPLRVATLREDLLMMQLRDAEAVRDLAAAVLEPLRQKLMEVIGESSGIESPAGVITWKSDKNDRRSFRTKWSNK